MNRPALKIDLEDEKKADTERVRENTSITILRVNERTTETQKSQKEQSLQNETANNSQIKKLANGGEVAFACFLILLIPALFIAGNLLWDEDYYTPDEGLGYYLGLSGGIMMLFALSYGFCKNIPLLRKKRFIKPWLKVHILFGITGPIIVILHSTFTFHSFNGAIALISMLLVFLSGLIGRFLYSKIHYGIGGRVASFDELESALACQGDVLNVTRLDRLNHFKASCLTKTPSFISSFWLLLSFSWRTRLLYLSLTKDMRKKYKTEFCLASDHAKKLREDYASFKKNVKMYLSLLRKAAFFNLYKSVFVFWRHAHVPLLYLLFFSGIIHVIAVHLY